MGKSLNHYSVKEKRLSLSEQVPFLWNEGRRAGAYFDPLPLNMWGHWTGLLSAFGATWVCPLLVKDFLLSYQCLECEMNDKRRKKLAGY